MEKTEREMNEMLKGLGYTFDPDILCRTYQECIGKTAEAAIVEYHHMTAVFIVLAYNAGREGKSLASVAPWLVKE